MPEGQNSPTSGRKILASLNPMVLPNLSFEEKLWRRGFDYIVGIDEVGRGSWAGPLVAAGVILPKNFQVPSGFVESKQLTAAKREKFAELISNKALAVKISEISHSKINKIGISRATQFIFRKIVRSISLKPDYFLVDAFHIRYFPKSIQLAIKEGDKKSASIAAASIVAKVYRDSLMSNLSQKFPNYGFEKHKGYGTKHHRAMIKLHGFARVHRTSFNLNYLIS
ncbi:MAG: Ribonuclease HII [Candidatus Curtissbacteria bacterium GW2011_GWA1_41_11]|uniref:Ribonuclease HII n=1 Tax=Candidatus Curtissbacteria bacterium GW2011_GWA1_41_11 TaxID=1618409 RepID=A0A0G0XK16_9BACT|nr:MAG: Ribonuclease HII [Candidatus Curtissbacteria bacterium GW2011_GWA1_41_11]